VLFFIPGAVVAVVVEVDVVEVGAATVVVIAVTVRSLQQWYITISKREELAESYSTGRIKRLPYSYVDLKNIY